MSPSRLVLVSLVVLTSHFAAAQQPTPTTAQAPQRDPQALSVLAQSLAAAGGAPAIAAIQGFVATGNVTYYWANQEIQGSVIVRSRGANQFRLDANLPDGVRTWLLTNDIGTIRESSGYTHEIPFHNAINSGSLTFPYPFLIAALNDPSTTIEYLGSVTNNGHTAYHIRIEPIPLEREPSGLLRRLTTKDLFIDAASFQVQSTLDKVHPDYDYSQDYPHEIRFSDYSEINGILVPISCSERVAGQLTWSLKLAVFELNSELTDNDFEL
jgi:hypothetical protein